MLAAAALPSPPPLAAFHPDPTDPALPALEDPAIAELLDLLPRADIYLQDEVQLALHPTLTRVWSRRGRCGQRLVEAPGTNRRKWGFGAVDWRDGWLDWAVADQRAAEPCCAQLRRLIERSKARGRVALVVWDNLGIHTTRRSKKLRALLAEETDHVRLVYTPSYDPDANRIEWLWADLRDAVTHNHQRHTLDEVLADAAQWVDDLTATDALRHIGSPGAVQSLAQREMQDAA